MAVNAGGFIGPKSAPEPAGPLSVAELREAIGSTNLTDERLRSLLESATEIVERFADAAPTAVKREAIIRVAAWVKASPPTELFRVAAGGVDMVWKPLASRNALRSSGAAGLLAPWRRPRGLVVGDEATSTTAPDPKPKPNSMPEPEPMPTLPSLRFFRVELMAGVSGLPQVNAWTAQQWIDNASGEVPGATLRTVSMAAPVFCYQAAYHYAQGGTQYEWAAVAVAHGDEPPTHYRLGDNLQPDNWPQRWTQAGGQAVIEGEAHSIHFWPVVVAAFPATLRFEWPA